MDIRMSTWGSLEVVWPSKSDPVINSKETCHSPYGFYQTGLFQGFCIVRCVVWVFAFEEVGLCKEPSQTACFKIDISDACRMKGIVVDSDKPCEYKPKRYQLMHSQIKGTYNMASLYAQGLFAGLEKYHVAQDNGPKLPCLGLLLRGPSMSGCMSLHVFLCVCCL